MGASDAERARRSRAHRKGEHHLCDPNRCESAAGAPVTDPVTAVTRDAVTLGPGGKRLWKELDGDKADAGRRVLILQAARTADRLDRLDDFLRGREDSWMKFHARNEDGSIVEVVIDKALSEERQQAVTLKQLIGELRQSAGKADQPERKADGSDELAKRRADRRAAAGL